jgi:dTMP kinase
VRRAGVERGRLIAFEGIDGCGKSTQARILAESLGALLTYEPGDTPLGAGLRELILHSDGALSPRAEALMVAADRAQHVDEVLEPALASGRWVVTDRFDGSTLAYQGFGRGLDEGQLRSMLGFATSGLHPDLSVLVDVPLEVARARVKDAGPDRLERLDRAFHQRVADGYRSLAAADGDRWVIVDGSGALDEVARSVAVAVAERLGAPT